MGTALAFFLFYEGSNLFFAYFSLTFRLPKFRLPGIKKPRFYSEEFTMFHSFP